LQYFNLCLPQQSQDSGKNSEHEGNELETLSEKCSKNQKSEKESENASDRYLKFFQILTKMYQADSELHKDEGGICFVTLSHGIDE